MPKFEKATDVEASTGTSEHEDSRPQNSQDANAPQEEELDGQLAVETPDVERGIILEVVAHT